jgi:hypothetical protein
MRLIDKRPVVSRRSLLKTGAAVAAIVPTIGTAAAAPMAVSADAFATLVKMARDIYPHDQLADGYYAKVMQGIDAAAKDDAAAKTMLEEGVAALNTAAAGGSYAGLANEADRVVILKSMEASPFFQKIRGSLVTGLYNNPEVWPIFGYEGESAGKGGYVDRGFNDINWL